MADERLTIQVDADADGAIREIRGVDRAVSGLADNTAKHSRRMGTAMNVAAGVGFVELGKSAIRFGRDAVGAFTDADVAMRRAETMLDRNNQGWRKHRGEIDRTIKAHMELGAYDDEELYESFANLARVSGSTTEAMKAQQLAMDIARGKGISLAAATKVLEKVYNGNAGALKKYGVEVEKGASTHEVLAAAQKQFAGQAKAFGDSNAGAAAKMAVTWGNVQETIGEGLLPVVSALFDVFREVAPYIQSAASAVAAAFRDAWPTIIRIGRDVGKMLRELWADIGPSLRELAAAFGEVAAVVADHWPEISKVLEVVLKVVGVAIKVIAKILAEYVKIWIRVVMEFVDAVVAIGEAVAGAAETVADGARAIWDALEKALTAPLRFGEWLNEEVIDPIRDLAGNAARVAADLARAVWTGITGVAGDMAGWLNRTVVQPIVAAYANVLQRGAAVAQNIWTGIRSVVGTMVEWIRSTVIAPITERLPAILSKGKDIAESVWRGIRSFGGDMIDYIRDNVIAKITDRLSAILEKGKDIAEAIGSGMRQGAAKVADSVIEGFKGFLNRIIGVINRLPFVDIPKLATGGVVTGPTLALIGEDGDEVVVPTSAKHRGDGARMLSVAAQMLNLPGDGPGPRAKGNVANRIADAMNLPAFANGGVVLSNAAAAGTANVRSAVTRGVGLGMAWDTYESIVGAGAGKLIGQLPHWQNDRRIGGVNALGGGIRSSAAEYIKGWFDGGGASLMGPMIARAWATSQMGKPYVWGGGHGGWDYDLPGYDCSGFASHAAKKAGAALSGPGTTMSLFPASRPGNGSLSAVWGFRGMDSNDPRSQHMGIKLLGDWFQFGNPGHSGGSDGQWSSLRAIPGLPGYRTGTDYVPGTGPAMLHMGEAVLNRSDAARYRAGAPSVAVVIEDGALGFLSEFIRVEVDDMAEQASRSALAGGAVR